MPKINVLPKEISELIAAGEVVERPASAVKEAVENSIDAGARSIIVEIRRGGIAYIRITDDGCGISHLDVPLSFIRHATSKISSASDLNAISSLGFRGEALAALSSVARVEMITKTASEDYGTHYITEGGAELLYEECGAQTGTTLIIRDLFYNTPARMKFLKKDSSEGNAVSAVVLRAALSHPEISFKFIRDNRTEFFTDGSGDLKSAVYSLLGRDFASSLIPVETELNGILVSGFTCKPIACRQSRAGQYTFLNGRLVKSGTVSAAAEQAYKNSAMIGKYPCFVLNINMPFDTVDVNVHPAKTEVRFSDERRVFEAVYTGVKSAILAGDTRPLMNLNNTKKAVPLSDEVSFLKYESAPIKTEVNKKPEIKEEPKIFDKVLNFRQAPAPAFIREEIIKKVQEIKKQEIEEKPEIKEDKVSEEIEVRLIGEAFSTYIIVEKDESVFIIDKHAAHERILFNELSNNSSVSSQSLLAPLPVTLESRAYSAVTENLDAFLKLGFELEDFGNMTVAVRAIPSVIKAADVSEIITEAAELLQNGAKDPGLKIKDHILHTVACKAAIKAGYKTMPAEMISLAKKVLSDKDVFYCPHGRPVAFEITKKDFEKQFKRIQ